MKNCSFFIDEVAFLGFVVSSKGVSADLEKIRAILGWSEPKNIHDVQSFHGLGAFYYCLIGGFSMIMAPFIACLRGKI